MKKILLLIGVCALLLIGCGSSEVTREDLNARFFRNQYGDAKYTDLEAVVEENASFYKESSYWEEVFCYRESEWGDSEAACRIYPLFHTDLTVYTEEDFKDVPENIILLARNEIYARHGYIFEDTDLNHYFMGCEWYQPMYMKDEFDTELLNENEWDNLELLVSLSE